MGETTQARGAAAAAPPVALLEGGPEAFPRMLDAIEAAERWIHLEVYTFERDGVGGHFLEALAQAARRGVRVSVVIDGWGSAPDGRFIEAVLGAAGCDVRIYNPLVSVLVGRFRRDHRKILVVDDEVAFLGGINVADAYGHAGPRHGPAAPGVPSPWLDLAIEVRGPAAAWLGARLRGSRRRQPPGPVRIHLSGRNGGRKLRRRYVKAIGGARREALVAHAYFLPDRRLVRSITAAARRGVRVKLLLAGRSDVLFARAASRRLYRQLLAAGVEIHEWTESVFHAKAAVVDGARLFVGSFNLDPFSLANLEALVEVDEAAVARAGEAWFHARLAQSRRVRPEDLEARTALQRWLLDAVGLWAARVAQWLGRLLALR